jgi:cytidyltransferase-like protein
MAPDNRIAVCPGSYDPITHGHVDVITRASQMFDELIVAVVNASVRKSKSLFSADERIDFIEGATGHRAATHVEHGPVDEPLGDVFLRQLRDACFDLADGPFPASALVVLLVIVGIAHYPLGPQANRPVEEGAA